MQKFTRFTSTLFYCGAALLGSFVIGQEEEIENAPPAVTGRVVIASSDEDEPQAARVMMMSSDDGFQNFTFAAPIMGDLAGSDPSTMLHNKQVVQELELSATQSQELKDLRAEFGRAMTSQFKGMENGKLDLSNPKELKKTMEQLRSDNENRINEILLPHQQQRLQQIMFQMKMRNRGNSNTLVSKSVAEELGLTEEQVENIKKRAEEIKKKLEEDMAKLKKEARDELIDELTVEQRQKLEEMMGDDFEYKRPDFKKQIEKIRSKVRKRSKE